MSSIIKNIQKNFFYTDFADEYSNDLNQNQMVNFSYLFFCSMNLIVMLIFLIRQTPSIALFCFFALLLGLVGLCLNFKKYRFWAEIMLPIVAMVELSILSLFYFGTGSALHWFLIDFIIYALSVFRSDQKGCKYGTAICTVGFFLVCELMGTEKGLYLSAQDQKISLILVFLCSSFAVAVIVALVVNRLRAVNEHLRILTEQDELTGLSNRHKVLADAANIFFDSVINHNTCVFAIIDLDHFKRINDTFGHEAGDLVLAKVSQTMASVVRHQDEIGRYGGEEFIVIMRKATLKQAEVVMERIRVAVEEMFIETEQGIVIPVTISIGLSIMEPGVSRYEQVLAQASKALHAAKRNGRNRIAIESSLQN